MESVDTDLLEFYFKQKDELNSMYVSTKTKVRVEKNVATVVITLENNGYWKQYATIYKLGDNYTIYNLMRLLDTNFYLLQTVDFLKEYVQFLKELLDEKKEENEGSQEADASSARSGVQI